MRHLLLILLFLIAYFSNNAQLVNQDGSELQNLKNLQKYWNMRFHFLGDNTVPEKYPDNMMFN